jgi:hypothetical protein
MKADDCAPVVMPVQNANKELGFGHFKVRLSLLLLHKVGEMLRIPCALRLVKTATRSTGGS